MLIKRHHRKVTFIVMFTESQLRRRKINDILRSGDAYKSIPTPSLPLHPPPPHLPSMPYAHAHTPFVPKYFKIKTVPSCEGHACVTITPEDSSQANTYLTVKTSQVCKCKLFVSVSFLDYAENFLLKVKLKGNKFCVIYLYSFSKKYREIFLKKLLKPAYENLHNFILYLLFKF